MINSLTDKKLISWSAENTTKEISFYFDIVHLSPIIILDPVYLWTIQSCCTI